MEPCLTILHFDLSSISDTWRIRFKVDTSDSGGESSSVQVYYLRKITGSETSIVTEYLSSNNGTNFTEADGAGYVSIPTDEQGYQMVPQLTTTPAAGEGVFVDQVYYQMFTDND